MNTALTHRLEATWNTGRPYTKDGQRIAVFTVETDDARFFVMQDFDRQITNCFEHEDFESEPELRRYIQNCYDYNTNQVYGQYASARETVTQYPLHTLKFRLLSY